MWDSTGSLERYYFEACITDGIDTTCRNFIVRIEPLLKIAYSMNYEGCGTYDFRPYSLPDNLYDFDTAYFEQSLNYVTSIANDERIHNGLRSTEFYFDEIDTVIFSASHFYLRNSAPVGYFYDTFILDQFNFYINSSDTIVASNQPILLTYTSNEKLEDVRWKITHLDTNIYSKIYKGDSVNVYLPYVGKYNVQVLGLGKTPVLLNHQIIILSSKSTNFQG